MRIEHNKPPKLTLGIYVHLEQNPDGQYRIINERGSIHQMSAKIQLPDSTPTLDLLHHAVKRVLQGERWPLIFDWENLSQYFSMEQMLALEKCDPNLHYSVYNYTAGPVSTSSLDVKKIYLNYRRQEYAQKREQAKEAKSVG